MKRPPWLLPHRCPVNTETLSGIDLSCTADRRGFIDGLRAQAAAMRAAGKSGITVAVWFSDQLDQFLSAMIHRQLSIHGVSQTEGFAAICVGGNGRRRPAPWSDVDLLLVCESSVFPVFEPVMAAFTRDCWDTGIQLGHSTRHPEDVIRFAIEDIQFATSLIDMRLLTGDELAYGRLHDRVRRKLYGFRPQLFADRCVSERREEWKARGDSVNHLKPDVKRSPGGLRDIHLLQWVCFARYGDTHLSTLLEHGEIRTQELAALTAADEFLTSLRLDLHCATGMKQDVLTMHLQLQLAPERVRDARDERHAAEQFMQQYFEHTSQVAAIARRITETQRQPSLLAKLRRVILPTRDLQNYHVHDGILSVRRGVNTSQFRDPLVIMDAFVTAARHGLILEGGLQKLISQQVATFPKTPSHEVTRRFRRILRASHGLPNTLRTMFETGVLEWLIPEFAGIRNLMQFNQYHSFTVDEHTLRTIEEVVAFEEEESPVGAAYRAVRHKATLHLSLLMHDIGKGRDGDHSLIGAGMCETVGLRLQQPENKKRMMEFLVRQHLVMPDLAFRRDISDQALLVEFARLVGSPELLRMLYVLCVADIKAVGPDVWTDWKGELLTELYNRTMELLSGRPFDYLEKQRLQRVRDHVRQSIVPIAADHAQWAAWIDRQLEALPPFYLMTEDPDRIARDLDVIQQLGDANVEIEGSYDHETDTVGYRIFASSCFEPGSFHKISGILSGMRMDIHAAQTCTTHDNIVIASFLVSDNDFTGPVPTERIGDVSRALKNVLTGSMTVDSVFRRSGVFRLAQQDKSIVRVPPQVSIDNDCSENHTVIDVFAMDTPGLLYALALCLYNFGLSVQLTRIATRIDQVVDVFYVVDADGRKVATERLHELYVTLMNELTELYGHE